MTMANPFGHRVRLFSETAYNLTIRKNGDILGTQDDADEDTLIEICSGDKIRHIRLLGQNSNLYVCYTRDGKLYGESDPLNPGTIFTEEFQGSYSAYKSAVYPEWYIGITKKGLPKKGDRTKYGQKAVKFLPRQRQ